MFINRLDVFCKSNASEVNKCYDKTVFLLTVTSRNSRFYYQHPYGFDRNFNYGFNRHALAFLRGKYNDS